MTLSSFPPRGSDLFLFARSHRSKGQVFGAQIWWSKWWVFTYVKICANNDQLKRQTQLKKDSAKKPNLSAEEKFDRHVMFDTAQKIVLGANLIFEEQGLSERRDPRGRWGLFYKRSLRAWGLSGGPTDREKIQVWSRGKIFILGSPIQGL